LNCAKKIKKNAPFERIFVIKVAKRWIYRLCRVL